MSHVRIDDWEFDDDNLEHLALHGITADLFFQVAEGEPRFRKNKKARAAALQLVGPDHGGCFWVICLAKTRSKFTWRPVTGWQAREQDIQWYKRSS